MMPLDELSLSPPATNKEIFKQLWYMSTNFILGAMFYQYSAHRDIYLYIHLTAWLGLILPEDWSFYRKLTKSVIIFRQINGQNQP